MNDFKKYYCVAFFITLISIESHISANSFSFKIIVETGSNEFKELMKGPSTVVFQDFEDTIKQQVPMVAHSGLLVMLLAAIKDKAESAMELSVEKKQERKALFNSLQKDWEVKINKAEDWVVLKPKNYSAGQSLASLGFNMQNLDDFLSHSNSILTAMQNEKFKPINIETLKNIFDQNSSIRKRILVMGHGSSSLSEKPVIAGLSKDQYFEFLKFLNPNTDFLYMFSCYAGGLNSVQFHDREIKTGEEVFSLLSIKFPIVLGSTYEAPTTFKARAVPDYRKFFNLLNEYLNEPTSARLKDALNVLYKEMASDSGIPLIRFPGVNKMFRAVDLDKTIILLTMVSMRKQMLAIKDKRITSEITPLAIGAQQKLLVYPALITIPLQSAGDYNNKIISMIPGNASHFFDQVTLDGNFSNFLNGFARIDEGDISVKCFVFKKLKCSDAIFENASIVLSKENYRFTGKCVSVPENKKLAGSYVTIKTTLSVFGLPGDFFKNAEANGLSVIDAKTAKDLAQRNLGFSKPNPQALNYATAGMQTPDMVEQVSQEFLASIK